MAGGEKNIVPGARSRPVQVNGIKFSKNQKKKTNGEKSAAQAGNNRCGRVKNFTFHLARGAPSGPAGHAAAGSPDPAAGVASDRVVSFFGAFFCVLFLFFCFLSDARRRPQAVPERALSLSAHLSFCGFSERRRVPPGGRRVACVPARPCGPARSCPRACARLECGAERRNAPLTSRAINSLCGSLRRGGGFSFLLIFFCLQWISDARFD